MGSGELKKLPFDQYQRYKNVADIVNRLRKDKETFRILEVGANEHQNLEKFLPDDSIQYLDIKLPEHLLDNPRYILGDATDMTFDDSAYDVVVALDVFEHIPTMKREKFIDELYRVSARFYILTAPFSSLDVHEAEERVNNVFKSFFGQDFIWLQEHLENGLPRQLELENYLKSKNISYQVLSHGDINTWERIMKIHFITASNPNLIPFREEIDKFYNSYMFDYDYTDKSYRKIFTIYKNNDIKNVGEGNYSLEVSAKTFDKLTELECMFYNLAVLLTLQSEQKQFKDSLKDRIQIYFDSGSGFKEEESLVREISQDQLINHIFHEFSISSLMEPIKSIRIDPSDLPGVFIIKNIKLVDVDNNELEYKTTGNFNYEFNNVLIFEKNDPQFIVELPAEVRLRSLEFDVFEISADNRLLVQHFKDLITSLDETNKQLLSENAQLISEKEDINQKFNQLQNNNNDVIESLEIAQNEVSVLKGLLEKMEIEKNEENHYLKQQLLLREQELSLVINSNTWKIANRLKKLFRR